MKKFDLEKALAGEPVVTRDEQAVKQVTKFDIDRKGYPLCAVVNGALRRYDIDGRYNHGDNHDLDLFMAEPERWVNVYWSPANYGFISSVIYSSEAKAKADVNNTNSSQHYQTTIKLK
jgi:hypothetical protein